MLSNTILVTGTLVTSNLQCMELYNLVGYHKATDLLACIDKNLKFKKGVGIAIKSKETSSKLAI